MELGEALVGVAERLQDAALLFGLLRLKRRGCGPLAGFVHGLAQRAGGGGLEVRIGERRAGRHLGIHRLDEEVGEEVGLADAVNVEADLEQFAGQRAQAVEALLLPETLEGEGLLDGVGGVRHPVLGEARAFP